MEKKEEEKSNNANSSFCLNQLQSILEEWQKN